MIVVIGMHRSGTSVVANLLKESGIEFGTNLVGKGLGNAKGHFENKDLLELTANDLVDKGFRSDGIDFRIKGSLQFSLKTRKRFESIIDGLEEEGGLIGIKEPRSTLFYEQFDRLNRKCFYVLVLRNHNEVVASLVRRHKTKVLKGIHISGMRRALHILLLPLYSIYLVINGYHSWVVYNRILISIYNDRTKLSHVVRTNNIHEDYTTLIDKINSYYGFGAQRNVNSQVWSPEMMKKSKYWFKVFSLIYVKSIRDILKELH